MIDYERQYSREVHFSVLLSWGSYAGWWGYHDFVSLSPYRNAILVWFWSLDDAIRLVADNSGIRI